MMQKPSFKDVLQGLQSDALLCPGEQMSDSFTPRQKKKAWTQWENTKGMVHKKPIPVLHRFYSFHKPEYSLGNDLISGD